jgi:hypothetical protein
MTKLSVTVVKFISPLAALAKPSSKPKAFCSLQAMRAALSTEQISLLMAV